MQKRTYFLSKMAKYIGSLEKNLVCSKKSLLFTLLKYSLFSNADKIYMSFTVLTPSFHSGGKFFCNRSLPDTRVAEAETLSY